MASQIYSKLNADRREIRLLTIQPGYPESPLECDLQIASLLPQVIPRYHTMSYCWHNARRTAMIFLNGEVFHITIQAAYVLWLARRTYVPRVVWIDLLCINQADEEEQAQQVAMMAEIYHRSVRNLICLTPSDSPALDDRETRQALLNISAFFREEKRKKKASFNLRDYKTVLSSPWFERLWVVQECLLAPSNTVFLDDDEVDLGQILETLESRPPSSWHGLSRSSQLRYLAAINLWNWMNPNSSQRLDIADSPGKILSSLLHSFGSLSCTRLHDKIYGLLGIFKYLAALQHLPPALQPDYQQDPILTIIKATRYVVIENAALSVHLFLVDRSPIAEQLPSWAYDWTYRASTGKAREECAFPYDKNDLPACGDLLKIESTLDEDSDIRILSLEGIPVAHFTQRTEIINGHFLPTTQEIAQLLHSIGFGDLESAERFIALFSTRAQPATADRLSLLNELRFRDRKWTTDDVAISEDVRLKDRSWPERPQETPSQDNDIMRDNQHARAFEMGMKAACTQRRILVTDTGFLVLGPRTAEIGDELAILAGCEMPVVLRLESEGMHRLIGPAYMSGIMHGEAVVAHLESGQKPKVYNLI